MAGWIARVIAITGIVACGGGGPTEPGPDDVRVTVYQFGAPAPDAIVWFSDPVTGESIAEATTGADGAFFAAVPAGSAVTAAARDPGADPAVWQLYTIAEVEPGDDLVAGSNLVVDRSMMGGIEVSLPGAFAGAAFYDVSIGCRAAQQTTPTEPILVWVTADCLSTESRVTAVAHARDIDGNAIAFAPAVDVEAPAAGDVTPLSAGDWQTDFSTFTLTVLGIPPTSSVRSQLTLFDEGAEFAGGEQEDSMPAAGTATHEYSFPTGLATRLLWQVAVVNESIDSTQMLIASPDGPDPPDSDSFDLTDGDLPGLSAAGGAIDTNGSPALSWETAGDASAADGVFAIAQWVNPNQSQLRWHMYAPPGATAELVYPSMPESMQLYRGVLGAEVDASISLIAADHIGAYSRFRAESHRLFDPGLPVVDLRMRVTRAATMGAL